MKVLLIGISMWFALVSLTACDTDESMTEAERLGSQLQQSMEQAAALYDFPGAMALVRFNDGSSWTAAYGLADLETETPLSVEMLFRIGSVSKTFTGEAILLLVQDGKLSLEDTVESLVPGLLARGSDITVKMLLEHSSGLVDYATNEDWFDEFYEDISQSWQPEQLLTVANANELLFTPGEGASYSNSNYITLGLIVEQVSGMSYGTFVRQRILEPLGLSDTSLPTDTEIPGDYAKGYLAFTDACSFQNPEDMTRLHPSAFWSAGGFVSSLSDLLVWLDELTDSRLLQEPLHTDRLICDNMDASIPGAGYGLGLGCLPDAVGHTGAIPGYTTVMFHVRDVDIVVFANGYLVCEQGPILADKIFNEMAHVIFPDWAGLPE